MIYHFNLMTEYHPIITDTAIIFDLHKPIYQSFFGIWDKWLKITKIRHLNMIVNSPFGKCTYTYDTWMNGAKKMNRFYKNPNEPMVFYGREILPDIKMRALRKKQEEKENTGMTKNGAGKLLRAYNDMIKARKQIALDK